jgi:hypothetical protein
MQAAAAENVKTCTKCKQEKPATVEFFCGHPTGKFGLQAACKACSAKASKEYRATPNGKKARKEYRSRPDQKEKQGAYDKARWLDPEHKEKKKSSDKERNAKPEVLERRAKQKRDNRLNSDVKAREHEYNRSDQRVEWRRNWQKKYFYDRERRDPQFKLRLRFGTAIRDSLKARGDSKRKRGWESLVGYTVSDLKIHLERQFQPWMTWANYGKWHIDHIVPQVSFKYTTTESPEFRACWSLTNLRPFKSTLNISKGGRRTHLL